MIPITPGEVAISQPLLFPTTVDIYSEGATGEYDAAAETDIPAMFSRIGGGGAATSTDRSELLSRRQFRWPLSYVLRELDAVQIEDQAGQRWRPISGTYGETLLYRYADVVRIR